MHFFSNRLIYQESSDHAVPQVVEVVEEEPLIMEEDSYVAMRSRIQQIINDQVVEFKRILNVDGSNAVAIDGPYIQTCLYEARRDLALLERSEESRNAVLRSFPTIETIGQDGVVDQYLDAVEYYLTNYKKVDSILREINEELTREEETAGRFPLRPVFSDWHKETIFSSSAEVVEYVENRAKAFHENDIKEHLTILIPRLNGSQKERAEALLLK